MSINYTEVPLYLKNTSKDSERYKTLYKICSGSCSKLYKGYDTYMNRYVIIKKINKNNGWENELINLYKLRNNDMILNLIDYYENFMYIFFVCQFYSSDIDIFKHVFVNIPYSELNCKILLSKMLNCLKICHDKNIAHLDIKFDNFIYKNYVSQYDYSLVLIDFGHSEKMPDNDIQPYKNYSGYGTVCFLCPEGIDKYRSLASDIWSIGVCAYILLVGKYPFNGYNHNNYLKNVKNGKFKISELDKLSNNAKNFVLECLNYDPSKRPTTNMLLKHSFLNE